MPEEQMMDEMWGDSAVKQTASPEKAEYFRNSKYAMFIHWGVYSHLSNRWQNKRWYGISEWIMNKCKISVSQYEKAASEFNPFDFDAYKWVKLAQDAGMKYIVITAKHHDGFAMFRSSHPFNIADATPFRRDPMKELADACQEAGIGFGFYYSQFQDWHECNNWDPDGGNAEFLDYFNNKCLVQLRELLQNYGPLAFVWFDTPGAMTAEQSQQIVNLVRELQPQALINSRIGNGVGEYSTLGDNQIPVCNINGLWEAIDTTNNSWGYADYDANWIDSKDILQNLIRVAARGGNFMLNIGPDGKGNIPEPATTALTAAGKWVKNHGETIYGCAPSPWYYPLSNHDCTRQKNKLYLHLFNWNPSGKLYLYGIPDSLRKADWKTDSGTTVQLEFSTNNNWTTINLPLSPSDEMINSLELTFTKATEFPVIKRIGISPCETTSLPIECAQLDNCNFEPHQWMEKFGEWKHQNTTGPWATTSRISWEIDIMSPGFYRFSLDYGSLKHPTWELSTDEGEKLELYLYEMAHPDPKMRFNEFRAGVLKIHNPGKHIVSLSPRDASPDEDIIFALRRMIITPFRN